MTIINIDDIATIVNLVAELDAFAKGDILIDADSRINLVHSGGYSVGALVYNPDMDTWDFDSEGYGVAE